MKERLEAIVFSEGGEIALKSLLAVLQITEGELQQLVTAYNEQGRGTVLVMDDKKVLMRVAGEYSALVDTMRKDAQSQEISSAGLEVLAIILYCQSGSMSAGEVAHVRGVNSLYTLRQLTLRGLLNKVRKGNGYHYAPTAELLSLLGVTSCDSLPEVQNVRQRLEEYKKNHDTED